MLNVHVAVWEETGVSTEDLTYLVFHLGVFHLPLNFLYVVKNACIIVYGSPFATTITIRSLVIIYMYCHSQYITFYRSQTLAYFLPFSFFKIKLIFFLLLLHKTRCLSIDCVNRVYSPLIYSVVFICNFTCLWGSRNKLANEDAIN